jgi:glycosyltransferase involved in cell wall biosynthesis
MIASPLESHSVTIVTSAFNEKYNLPSLLSCIDKTFQNLGLTLPMLLIDDGSIDGGEAVIAELENQYDFLTVIRHSQRLGLTECLKTVIANTDTDWLYLTPADLESDPSTDLPILLNACESGIDVVAGWRQNRRDGKTLASTIANLTCRLSFGLKIHDMNWIKLIRRDILVNLPLERVTYAYILPVLAGLGYHIVEAPTPWHPRRFGKSKFSSERLIRSAQNFGKLWWWFYIKRHHKVAPRGSTQWK